MDSKVPLNHQIYLNLKEAIVQKDIKEGEKIPSEAKLVEIFGVSRITVRKAVDELARKGYVKKQQGKGTIVLPMKQSYNLQQLTSFSHDVKKKGSNAQSKIRVFSEIPANEFIAETLNINAGDLVYYLERIRYYGEEIIGLHKAYIRKKDMLDISKGEMKDDTSLYSLFESKGVFLKEATETIEAIMTNQELNEILNFKEDQPVFYRKRLSYDEQDVPIEYVEMYYDAKVTRYEIKMNIEE